MPQKYNKASQLRSINLLIASNFIEDTRIGIVINNSCQCQQPANFYFF